MMMTLFAPELTVLATAVVFVVLACLPTPDARRDYLTAAGLGALTLFVALTALGVQGDLFQEAYRVDRFSQVFKTLLALAAFLVILLCRRLQEIPIQRHAETYLLLSTATLGLMLLVSSVHLFAFFMALELSSYSLYLLVFLHRDQAQAQQAGLRYFLVGTSTSAVMLFGLALLYGATGTAHLGTLTANWGQWAGQPTVLLGLLLTLAGGFFKLALFPFHSWAPDAYERAAHSVAAYIATASKVAAAAALLRLTGPLTGAGGLLVECLALLAILSMTVGNLAAVAQTDFKRLMAFSSIAHAGYLLIGVLTFSTAGSSAVVFYAVAILVMKYTCFLVLVQVSGDGRNLAIADLAGLHRRSPLLALALMMALFGLAGIPPTIGFSGKLLLFHAALQKGHLLLVLIAMFNVVISLYYYLRVLKAAYLTEPVLAQQPPIPLATGDRALVLLLIAAITLIGFYPAGLLHLTEAAAQVLF
ncbi:MAG: NADH-quinone oxidoreductase subunit N [Desulfosarcinaceae bacterium]|nr:NADH-quinone oxidoreductase subunit N [Desulfosarcinaceae bacterium]